MSVVWLRVLQGIVERGAGKAPIPFPRPPAKAAAPRRSPATLEDVVRHYETHLGFIFTDEERADLVAFLNAL